MQAGNTALWILAALVDWFGGGKSSDPSTNYS